MTTFVRFAQWLRRLFAPRARAVSPRSGPPLQPLVTEQARLWAQADAATTQRVVEGFFSVSPMPTEHLDTGVWLLLGSARPRDYQIPDARFTRVLALEAAARTLALVVPLPAQGDYTLQWRPWAGTAPEVVADDGTARQ